MASFDLNPVSSIANAVGGLLDDLFTSDEERLKAGIEARKLEIEEARIDAELLKGQQEVNKAEAGHASIFVAGWRPAVGWMCTAGIGYQYIAYPFMTWLWVFAQSQGWVPKDVSPPPILDIAALMTLLIGLLGLSTQRTIERIKGKARGNMKEE